ncbi:MAG: sensor histidine kinase [Bdellovibrionia bacterium]
MFNSVRKFGGHSKLDEQRIQILTKNKLAALGEFSAGIAHEINNPLAVISGKTTIIKRRLEQSGDQKNSVEDLEKVLSMVNRISKIIHGLRNFARDGESEPPTHFKAVKFFEDIRDMSYYRMQNRGIDIAIEVTPVDLEIYAREVQLSQVIINLVNNSMDAIANNKEKWIAISAWKEQGHAFIRIQDSGDGIPQEIREKIFQPFFYNQRGWKRHWDWPFNFHWHHKRTWR